MDLTARHGTAVVAAADGVVSESGWSGRYGKRVLIRHGHNGLSSNYAHLSEYYTTPGQVVRRGEVIGRVGRTGRTTSPHVHYEVRYRGTPVNPYKYLRRASPRRATLTSGGLIFLAWAPGLAALTWRTSPDVPCRAFAGDMSAAVKRHLQDRL